MYFVTSKVLLESKGKYFGLDFHCNSSSFIFNSKCNFSFSISMRSCISLYFPLISSLNLSCSNFFLSISLCFSLSLSSISNLIFSCSNFSLTNLSFHSNLSSLILSSLSSFSRLNFSSHSAFSTLILFSCSNLNFSI